VSDGPLVIGGTGGSGTRLFVGLAQSAGVQMGTLLNDSEDQLEIAAYFDRWINRWLTEDRACEKIMAKELGEIVNRHRAVPSVRWGWKEPRSVFLLEFLDRTFSGLRFLHVLRDGRDLAFSTNQNQLRKHGEVMLGSAGSVEPTRSIALWAKVNGAAADYAESEMEGRYLRLRFEDLLSSPDEAASSLAEFCGEGRTSTAALELLRPESLGAWRRAPSEVIRRLTEEAGPALARFGYL